jgi:hypothetical protein
MTTELLRQRLSKRQEGAGRTALMSLSSFLFELCSGGVNDSCLAFTRNVWPSSYMVALLLVALLGCLLLYSDRQSIARDAISNDRVYFLIVLAFQLCAPSYFLRGWLTMALSLYTSCSVSLLVKVGWVVVYHSAFCLLQRLASVQPFTPLFYINAAITAIKCWLRDSNFALFLIMTIRRCALRRQRSGADQVSPGEFVLLEAEVSPAVPSFTRSLYRRYLLSFDLILMRHQTFLSESCSKAALITVILMQYAIPQLQEVGDFELVIPPRDKLRLAAGQAALWLLQLLTHIALLRFLTSQPLSAVLRSRVDAQYAFQEQDIAHAASSSLQAKASIQASEQAGGAPAVHSCGCNSCVLDYSQYVQTAVQQRLSYGDGSPAVHDSEVGSAAWPGPSRLCCCRPRGGSSGLHRLTHPWLNYWPAHRWYFVLQMLHWIWYVFQDSAFLYSGECGSTKL